MIVFSQIAPINLERWGLFVNIYLEESDDLVTWIKIEGSDFTTYNIGDPKLSEVGKLTKDLRKRYIRGVFETFIPTIGNKFVITFSFDVSLQFNEYLPQNPDLSLLSFDL